MIRGEGAWDAIAGEYLQAYEAAVRTGNFGPLPYERDPLRGPDRS